MNKITNEQLDSLIKSAVNSSGPLPPDEKFSQIISALRELRELRAAMLQGAEQQNQQQYIPENIPTTQFKPVADLYEVTVPGGRSTTFTKDAAEASDCRVMGWSVQEYVKLERYQVAMLQGGKS